MFSKKDCQLDNPFLKKQNKEYYCNKASDFKNSKKNRTSKSIPPPLPIDFKTVKKKHNRFIFLVPIVLSLLFAIGYKLFTSNTLNSSTIALYVD